MELTFPEPPPESNLTPFYIINIAILLFFAILFLQSGMDKVTDWKGNLDWLTGHFKKSAMDGMVPVLLGVLTVMEVGSGLFCVVAIIFHFVKTDLGWSLNFWALAACSGSLIALFFGQRIAKDYQGAAGIVPYFIAAVGGMIWMYFFQEMPVIYY